MSLCATADKVIYRSERAAKRAAREVVNFKRGGSGFLHAYRCGAHWHIGHGHKSEPKIPGRKFRL